MSSLYYQFFYVDSLVDLAFGRIGLF